MPPAPPPPASAGSTPPPPGSPGSPDAPGRGPVLLFLAREAIAAEFGGAVPPPARSSCDTQALPDLAAAWLDEPGACFVTLHLLAAAASSRPGPPTLRGCIGTIEAYRPLREDVRGNARAAAFRDPRFGPLRAAEYPRLHVEVSELSAQEPVPYRDRADLVAQLRPGVDGLVLEYGGRRGTYLPQVWEQIADPDAFLASLVQKAHLPRGFWSDDILLMRYTVTAYAEPLSEAT